MTDMPLETTEDLMDRERELVISLIDARMAKHFTQKELAHLVGVTQNTISRLESGSSNPTLNTINKVAAALGKELRLIESQ